MFGQAVVVLTDTMFSLRDHYGTQCSDGGERLQVNVQSTTGDYTLAEVMSVFLFTTPASCIKFRTEGHDGIKREVEAPFWLANRIPCTGTGIHQVDQNQQRMRLRFGQGRY